jgi:hypothetical protein
MTHENLGRLAGGVRALDDSQLEALGRLLRASSLEDDVIVPLIARMRADVILICDVEIDMLDVGPFHY